MILTHEIDTLTVTVTNVVELAAKGKLADSYSALLAASSVRSPETVLIRY
jgi:hypothetical protein